MTWPYKVGKPVNRGEVIAAAIDQLREGMILLSDTKFDLVKVLRHVLFIASPCVLQMRDALTRMMTVERLATVWKPWIEAIFI